MKKAKMMLFQKSNSSNCENDVNFLKNQSQYTPSLNIKCNKHGKKIILLNLDTNQTSNSRKVCIDCICENVLIYYTSSLHEATKRWKEYQIKTQISIKEYIQHKNFNNTKFLKYLMILKIQLFIQNLQYIPFYYKYTSFLHEQINKLKSLESKLNKLEENNIIEDSIYDLDEDQIDEIVRTLSQSDLNAVQLNSFQSYSQCLKSDSSQQQSNFILQEATIYNQTYSQDQEEELFTDEDFSDLDEYIAKFQTNSAQLKKINQIQKELKLKQLELEQIQLEKQTADQNQQQQLMELKKISDDYAEEIVNLKIQKQEIKENLNQNKIKTNSKIQAQEQ
ncbi:unnamed protein product [Paramecium octaurelia]|uniref:Uncharacterized protein n=1 Tax=Paramecium octaurelia TaxID=43137 RepID=A0A8S1RU83_PAROT|nr:unnamed protein product [Paramecium octaurelia]